MMAPGAWAQQDPQITWGETAPLPPASGEEIQYGVAGAYTGISRGRMIVAGGANFGDLTPWRGGVKEPSVRLQKPVAYGASVSYHDRVICIGGEDAGGPVRDVFSMEWTGRDVRIGPLSSLPQPITSAGAALIGSTVYLAGGMGKEGALNTFFCADLTSDPVQWKALPSLPVPLSHAVVAAQTDGQETCIYVIGGRNKPGIKSTFLSTIWKFSPSKQQWEMAGNITGSDGKPLGLAAGTGASVGDQFILLFGGDPGIVFNRVEEYLDAITQATDPYKEQSLTESKNQEQENHPGFLRDVLAFNTRTGKVIKVSEIPGPAQVTTQTAVSGHTIYIPSGEIRPGIRTPIVRTAVIL